MRLNSLWIKLVRILDFYEIDYYYSRWKFNSKSVYWIGHRMGLIRRWQKKVVSTFRKMKPVTNVLKIFTAVIYKYLKKANKFVHGRPFRPILMFASKAAD